MEFLGPNCHAWMMCIFGGASFCCWCFYLLNDARTGWIIVCLMCAERCPCRMNDACMGPNCHAWMMCIFGGASFCYWCFHVLNDARTDYCVAPYVLKDAPTG